MALLLNQRRRLEGSERLLLRLLEREVEEEDCLDLLLRRWGLVVDCLDSLRLLQERREEACLARALGSRCLGESCVRYSGGDES